MDSEKLGKGKKSPGFTDNGRIPLFLREGAAWLEQYNLFTEIIDPEQNSVTKVT